MTDYKAITWQIINAKQIYERDYQANTIRHARETKRNGNPAKNAKSDVLERELVAGAENAINAAKGAHSKAFKKYIALQLAIQINPDQVQNWIERFERKLRRNHNQYRTEYEDMANTLKAINDDIVAYRQEAKINREPILSHLYEVAKQASPFGFFESFIGTLAAKAAGTSLFEAMLIGISSTIVNIGLGAFLLAQVVPYTLKKTARNCGLWR